MGRDVGSAAGVGGRTRGRVLRLIEGKVSHFQTVGHDEGFLRGKKKLSLMILRKLWEKKRNRLRETPGKTTEGTREMDRKIRMGKKGGGCGGRAKTIE